MQGPPEAAADDGRVGAGNHEPARHVSRGCLTPVLSCVRPRRSRRSGPPDRDIERVATRIGNPRARTEGAAIPVR